MAKGPSCPTLPRAPLEIRKARLRRAIDGDRERLSRELDSIRPSDFGLGPRSVLLIPRLVAERPLRRSGEHGRFAGSVAATLHSALRRARRPWQSHSADDPLLFADEIEAAAELILSWLGGSPDRHWWPIVTEGMDPPTWWRREILRNAFVLPRIIARLEDKRAAARWIERLDSADVKLAIATIVETFGLTPRVLAAPRLPPAARDFRDRPARHVDVSAVAQLRVIVPEIDEQRMSPHGLLLLAMALAAHRRPELLSTEPLQRAFRVLAEAPDVVLARGYPTHARSPKHRIDQRRTPAQSSLTPSLRTKSRHRSRSPLEVARPKVTNEPQAEAPNPQEARAASAAATQIATRFGGLFFVLNALLALDVYGDFTRPDRTLSGLSPFTLLALLGKHWFGRSFQGDPLHGLLLELAGEGASLANFDPPPWSIPRRWLDPWPNQRALLIDRHGPRTYLWHPAGFPMVELRRSDERSVRRASRTGGFRRPKLRYRHSRLPRIAQVRWISCLSHYLRARLALAFGRKDALAILCRQPATVEFDDDRVTARFALADHPLAVRLAGLDRNPGWVPAAGRIVEFAFE